MHTRVTPAFVARRAVLTYPDLGSAEMKKIVRVRAAGDFRVELRFDDGVEGTVDLSDLAGRGVFAAWSTPGEFEKVTAGNGDELVWSCGVDLCADALYLRATGKNPSDLFPTLCAAEAHRA